MGKKENEFETKTKIMRKEAREFSFRTKICRLVKLRIKNDSHYSWL